MILRKTLLKVYNNLKMSAIEFENSRFLSLSPPNMSGVYQVLVKSLHMEETLNLQSIVVVFYQARYAKATEIKWKHRAQFNDLVLRMGVSHTICTFLSVIRKRFQDAGLIYDITHVIIESGLIAEGSMGGALEGRRAVHIIAPYDFTSSCLKPLTS